MLLLKPFCRTRRKEPHCATSTLCAHQHACHQLNGADSRTQFPNMSCNMWNCSRCAVLSAFGARINRQRNGNATGPGAHETNKNGGGGKREGDTANRHRWMIRCIGRNTHHGSPKMFPDPITPINFQDAAVYPKNRP